MMNSAEILRAAAELPWTQDEMARDANGEFALWWESDAVCWCATGALAKVGLPLGGSVLDSPRIMFATAVLENVVGAAIPVWNDQPGRTHAEVKAAMIKAAEIIEADKATETADAA